MFNILLVKILLVETEETERLKQIFPLFSVQSYVGTHVKSCV